MEAQSIVTPPATGTVDRCHGSEVETALQQMNDTAQRVKMLAVAIREVLVGQNPGEPPTSAHETSPGWFGNVQDGLEGIHALLYQAEYELQAVRREFPGG